MCHPYFPAPGAEIFDKLSKGSSVVLSYGAGNPRVTELSVAEVILAVDKFSALTNTGRLLSCADAALIKATGDTLADGEYEIAPEAQELLHRAETRQAERNND